MDAFDPEPQGAFLSFLDWIDKPGQVVRNTLKGNFKGALKNAGDFLLDPIDAALPGDLIPGLAGEEDKVSGSQLINVDEKEHPILGFLADVGVGTLTDPLTFLGGPLLKGAGTAAKAWLEAAPKVAEQAGKAGQAVRRVTGSQRLSPETRAMVDRARAAGSNEKRAGLEQAKTALAGLNENELNVVGDVIDNFKWQDGKLVGKLGDDAIPAAERVGLHPEVTPQNAEKIKRAVAETLKLGQAQKARPNIFRDNGLSDEYLMRKYSGMDEEAGIDLATRNPSPAKGRTLNTIEDVQGFLNEKPGVQFERNALKRAASRADAQGVLAQRAEIGKALGGEAFAYTDDAAKKAVKEAIEALPPEEAQVVGDLFNGMKGRGAFDSVLASGNGLFKKYAVYGALIPKFGSIVRNKIGGIYQSLANPEARGIAAGQVKRFGSDLADATTQAFGFKRLSTGELTKSLDQIDAAFAASGGSAEGAFKLLPPDLADAMRNGVLDGYVSSEDLVRELAGSKWAKAKSIIDWPGKVFQGVESRMRLGAYLDLRKANIPADKAGRIVKDTFYDYATTSTEQRLASDLIPFWKFATKASEQTGKLIAEKPAFGVALSQVMQDRGDPVYPFMEGKTNIPIGADEEGNDQYITGLGLPFEALNMIPNPSGSLEDFGRDLERGVVGAANPLLKSAFSMISGEDPYFQTAYGSYDKIPGIGSAGDVGQLYNQVAQTGMIQPLDSLLRTIDDATDPRHNELTRLLDSLTGINVASVDPDRALQQQLQRALESDPDIRQYRSFYDPSGDPAAAELLRQYGEAKKKVKAKRN
jgi:hypothetical protein